MSLITQGTLVNLIGKELAPLLEENTLRDCMRDATDCSVALTPEEVAVARALILRALGSALLNGERGALVDAGTIYRMLCSANGLLIGTVKR